MGGWAEMSGVWGGLVVAAIAAGTATGQTPSLTFIPPVSGGIDSFATGISADGRFVSGESYTAGNGYVGFTWTREGGRVDWGLSPGVPLSARAVDITNDGTTAVGYRNFFTTGGVANTESFRFSNGTYTTIGPVPPNTNGVRATGSSGDGNVIVGALSSSRFERLGGAFRWTATGGLQDLGTARPGDLGAAFTGVSRDGRTAIGTSTARFDGADAFTWTEQGGWRSLPVPDGTGTSFDSNVYGLSDNGQYVVGTVQPSGRRMSAVVWHDALPMTLGSFGALWDMGANGVSGNGRIITGGAYDVIARQGQAVVWIDSGAPIVLQDLLASHGLVTPNGWRLVSCGPISSDGSTILGYAENMGRVQGFVAVIPAPTGSMIGIACGSWLSLRRRRGKRTGPIA